jgi:hypothetical protein
MVDGVNHKLKKGDLLIPWLKKHTDCYGTPRFNQKSMTHISCHKMLKLRKMLGLGLTLQPCSGKITYKRTVMTMKCTEDCSCWWLWQIFGFCWHVWWNGMNPFCASPQLLERGNLFLYLLDLTILKRLIHLSTVEVLNKFSGSEGSHILQIAPVRITIH